MGKRRSTPSLTLDCAIPYKLCWPATIKACDWLSVCCQSNVLNSFNNPFHTLADVYNVFNLFPGLSDLTTRSEEVLDKAGNSLVNFFIFLIEQVSL